MLLFLKKIWRRAGAFAAFTAAALAVGGLSALLAGDSAAELEALVKPPLTPPAWLFPPVWTALFILMGVSAALVWKSSRGRIRSGALGLWGAQLLVNFFWTILFFRLDFRLLALLWLLLLLLLVAAMISRFSRISRPAAALQLPYLLWLTFAGYLNLGFYLLNR